MCHLPKAVLNGVTTYDCRFGPQRHASTLKKNEQKRTAAQDIDHPLPRRSRLQLFSTTKVFLLYIYNTLGFNEFIFKVKILYISWDVTQELKPGRPLYSNLMEHPICHIHLYKHFIGSASFGNYLHLEYLLINLNGEYT